MGINKFSVTKFTFNLDLSVLGKKNIFLLLVFFQNAMSANFFEDVTNQTNVTTVHSSLNFMLGTGQAWLDVNNDGYEDIYFSNQDGSNSLFINNQNETFSKNAIYDTVNLPNSHDFGVSITDVNNDGFQDIFVTSYGQNKLLINVNGLAFQDVSNQWGLTDENYSIASTWADVNQDGWLDVYVVNYSQENDLDEADKLYLNDQGTGFIDASADLSPISHLAKYGLAVQFVDYDMDNDMDLYVINDKEQQNTLWRNDGIATSNCGTYVCFTDVSVLTQTNRAVWGMGIAIADYDLDGDFDFYFSSIAEQVLLVSQISQGSQVFIEKSIQSGLDFNAIGWATLFLDVNNDQFPDVYLATADRTVDKNDRLFISNQGQQFTDVSNVSGIDDLLMTIGAAKGDFNNDGLVDLVVGNWNENFMLYKNINPSTNNWVKFKLIGGQDINALAIGAKVIVKTSNGNELLDFVVSGGSHGAGNSLILSYGLGVHTLDDVQVIWPNGIISTYYGLAVNQQHQLTYPGDLIFSHSFE